MPVRKQIDAAATRLKDARLRIGHARSRAATVESQQEWLEALTDFVEALADIHTFNNDDLHEKLHHLAGRSGLRQLPPS